MQTILSQFWTEMKITNKFKKILGNKKQNCSYPLEIQQKWLHLIVL